MKSLISTVFILIIFTSTGFSQVSYSGKVELGYLNFNSTTIDVEPGENWKGYYLNDDQDGLNVNMINGIKLKEKLFAGIGVGYLNFEGVSGISLFYDFDYIPLKTKLSPLLNTKVGYSHIWNQYEDGKGTTLIELGAGLSYKLTERARAYVQSGLLFTQQSSLVPIKIGIQF